MFDWKMPEWEWTLYKTRVAKLTGRRKKQKAQRKQTKHLRAQNKR